MIDNVVRIGDLSQGLALVTLLPAPLLAGPSRRLLTRPGFFSPSLDGGLPLFELFNPSRRSSSAIRAFSDAFSALSAPISAISPSPDGSLSVSRIIRFLNRKPVRPSRHHRQFTSRSPNLGSNKNSKKVSSNEEIAQVGTISANGDAEIGRFLADAMKKVGNEGVITVEEAKSLETELEIVEGMQFDRAYISPYFVTNAEKMHVEMEDPYILIYEKKLSGLQELLPAHLFQRRVIQLRSIVRNRACR